MKKAIYSFVILAVLVCATGCYYYNIIYGSQINKQTNLYIQSTDSIANVYKKLVLVTKNIEHIKNVASLKKYKHPKPGMYVLFKGMNSNEVINLLRSGKQTPVKVTFNNQTYIEDLAGRISHQIEADSLSILNSLTDAHFLKEKGFTRKTVLNICMPYTYDCYWNIQPDQLRTKLYKTYKRYWNKKRTNLAKKLNLTINQVLSLAAIVQKETANKAERKTVAGVYLNRVQIGMPLQADPTVIYAIKEKYGRNTVIKRVLNKDLTISSPYNTYKQRGIPPSVITMPDVDAIEAVLHAEKHRYLYFCANPAKFGTHNFAKTLGQHNRNAVIYQRWLNQQKIKR